MEQEHRRVSILIVGGTEEERSEAGQQIANALAGDGGIFTVNGKNVQTDYSGERVVLFDGYTPKRFYVDFGYKDSRKLLAGKIGETILNDRVTRHREGKLSNLFSVVCTSGTEQDFYYWTTSKSDSKDYFQIKVDLSKRGVSIIGADFNSADLNPAMHLISNLIR